MPATSAPARLRSPAERTAHKGPIHISQPITQPVHNWLVSPARSHPTTAQAKELPLHLIQLIVSHLDDAADLARITRTSRLFYYMTLPRLYEHVTLRSHSDIRYIDGRPEGYGGGSPFAMGLNTLVSRNFTDYVHSLRLIGDWREHDVDDYKQGRVPDNSMMLQIAMRAVLDKAKNLEAFAWELTTKPMNTVYQGLVNRGATLTSLTLRFQTKRIPRPTTMIAPLPNLKTLVVYDMDPLCYPDDISLLLLGSKKLENLKMHWSPRMREAGEESVNLMSIFGQCLAARYSMRVKRFAMYNLYARFVGPNFQDVLDACIHEEISVFNSMGSSDPSTVFLDDSWRINHKPAAPTNLKMFRTDHADKEQALMLGRFTGLERLYIVSRRKKESTTPTIPTPNGTATSNSTPTAAEQCRSSGSEHIAVIQSNHRNMRHLLLSDHWQLSEDTLLTLCKSCPNFEQFGFSSPVPPMHMLRSMVTLLPKLWAMRMLVSAGSEFGSYLDTIDTEMHAFALATEMWRPEYKNIKYVGLGDKLVFKLGRVVFPPNNAPPIPKGQENSLNAKRAGPVRIVEIVPRETVKWIEIWGLDTTEFNPSFP